jgi:hypothetical protein
MSIVDVRQLTEITFEVTVQGSSSTTHSVTVPPQYAAKLTGGQATAEQLVRRSFDFLLQRESNTSILRSFELTVIARYFPEYERVIRDMLAE